MAGNNESIYISLGKMLKGDIGCPNNWSKVSSSAECVSVGVDCSNGLEKTGEPKGTNGG